MIGANTNLKLHFVNLIIRRIKLELSYKVIFFVKGDPDTEQVNQELKEFLGGHIVLVEGNQFCWYLKRRRSGEVVKSIFNDLFEFTNKIFTVMPLHFRPISNFISNLWTGMSWAQDFKEKTEIRILLWENEDEIEFGKELLKWDPFED